MYNGGLPNKERNDSYQTLHYPIRHSASSDSIALREASSFSSNGAGSSSAVFNSNTHLNNRVMNNNTARPPVTLAHLQNGLELSQDNNAYRKQSFPSSDFMAPPMHARPYDAYAPQPIPNYPKPQSTYAPPNAPSSAPPRSGRIGSNPSLVFAKSSDTRTTPNAPIFASTTHSSPHPTHSLPHPQSLAVRTDVPHGGYSSPSSANVYSSSPSLTPTTAVQQSPQKGLTSTDESLQLGTSSSTPSFYYVFTALRLGVTVAVLPSLILPFLLHFIPLQDPNATHGYAVNWAWAGVFMPLTAFLVSLYPTFIVSGIMGSIKSTAQALAWRISSITFACGSAIGVYALIAEVIYPRYSKNQATFPVPWTPIWVPTLTTIVATFTARLIRLQSDWRLPPNMAHTSTNTSQRLPPASVLQYASNKIKHIIRQTTLVYILSMLYCSLVLMVFKSVDVSTSDTKAEDVHGFFYYNAPMFVSLIIGKHIAIHTMKKVLASGGFYKIRNNTTTESKASPNIHAIVASAEYWWNLTECLLITSFLTKTLDIYFVHGLFVAECGYHYWYIRGQLLYVKQQSSGNLNPEPLAMTPSTAINATPTHSLSKIGRARSSSALHEFSPGPETNSGAPLNRLARSHARASSGDLSALANDTPSPEKPSPNSPLITRKRRTTTTSPQISHSSLNSNHTLGAYSSPGAFAMQGSVSELYPAELNQAKKKIMSAELLNLGSPIADTLQGIFSFSMMRLVGLFQVSIFHVLIPAVNQPYVRPIHIQQLLLMTLLNLVVLMMAVRYAAVKNIKLVPNYLVMLDLAQGPWTSLTVASMGWVTLWCVVHGGSLI